MSRWGTTNDADRRGTARRAPLVSVIGEPRFDEEARPYDGGGMYGATPKGFPIRDEGDLRSTFVERRRI
jgi:hypothetical protein